MENLTDKNKNADIFGFLEYLLYRAKQNITDVLVRVVVIGALLCGVSFLLVKFLHQSAERHGGDFWWWVGEELVIELVFFGPYALILIVGGIAYIVECLEKLYSDYTISVFNQP